MNCLRPLIRRQRINLEELADSKLKRCLSTFDLTLLGVGSTLGLGIYVIAGQVASTKAGPAVIISFFIAAVASVFAGLCYAEFGARVPRAGSAYVYSYVTVGELMAFIIGWNLILEYVIGAASVARGFSGYFDSLIGGEIAKFFERVAPIDVYSLAAYPDLFAFGIVLVLTVMLCFAVDISTNINNAFTFINILIVLYAVICGIFKSDITNWKLAADKVPKFAGNGGFMPYGISGLMSGAATCFYAFIGFDVIATTGEEVKNPQRSIPISIVSSLFIVFLAYFSVSCIQTLMWPYYDQYVAAPLPYVFEQVGWPVAQYIISVGALAGLSTSLLCAMFPLPRILYAMATDGLLFRSLANVNTLSHTPLLATIISGVFAGLMAMMFEIKELADMMSIGTLLAYSLVAFSVLVLRYKTDEKESVAKTGDAAVSEEILVSPVFSDYLKQLVNCDQLERPNNISSTLSLVLLIMIFAILIILDSLLVFTVNELAEVQILYVTCVVVVLAILLVFIFFLWRQPSSATELSFKVPLVPVIPLLSIGINMYLMLQLEYLTWIRFSVWMSLGLLIYFTYGLWNSSLRCSNDASKIVFVGPQVATVSQELEKYQNNDVLNDSITEF